MSTLVSSNPDNANPVVHKTSKETKSRLAAFLDEDDLDEQELELTFSGGDDSSSEEGALRSDTEEEPIDAQEVYDLIRSITDPEHPLTLEQLAVVSPEQIQIVHGPKPKILVEFTPTVSHCSLATLIGLTLRVRLLRSLPERFKVDIRVKQGSHESENSLNKQLNDKERVAAALENSHLLEVVQNCLASSGQRGGSVQAAH